MTLAAKYIGLLLSMMLAVFSKNITPQNHKVEVLVAIASL
jgi:hypothetical protein